MTQIRVVIVMEPVSETPGEKSSATHIKTLQVLDDEKKVYAIPKEYQSINEHPDLSAHPTILAARKQITKRWLWREVKVTLTETLKKKYFDEEGNVRMNDVFLEEVSAPFRFSKCEKENDEVEHNANRQPQPKPLTSITKDIILEKFNGKNVNPEKWIDMLELECRRLAIQEERFCEVLRLYIETPVNEWYSATRTTIGTSHWNTWRTAFLEIFAIKGWSRSVQAYTFLHRAGTVSEYALKKRNLLLDAEPTMSESIQIGLIMAGLDREIREKIDSEEIVSIATLQAKINKLGNIGFKKANDYRNKFGFQKNQNQNQTPKSQEKKECEPCKSKNRNYHHFESNCYFKNSNSSRTFMNQNRGTNSNNNNAPINNTKQYQNGDKKIVRLANNGELEDAFDREINQKN